MIRLGSAEFWFAKWAFIFMMGGGLLCMVCSGGAVQ